MKTIVIYHRSDFDGIFCREIAKYFFSRVKPFPNSTSITEYIGWEYGDPVPKVGEEDRLYIMDLSIAQLMNHPNLVWIDHHKSALEQFDNVSRTITGYRIDGVAACRLAYQWFLLHEAWDCREQHPPYALPSKEDFFNRIVTEPWAVRLAGEYDVWDKRDTHAELFQFGLRSEEIDWSRLLDLKETHSYVPELLEQGKSLQHYQQDFDKSIIITQGFDVEFEGLTFLAINHARFNSLTFKAGIKSHHDALLGFCWDGKKWKVSLYGIDSVTKVDLSEIAKIYGGGGHKQACGFTCLTLPFDLYKREPVKDSTNPSALNHSDDH